LRWTSGDEAKERQYDGSEHRIAKRLRDRLLADDSDPRRAVARVGALDFYASGTSELSFIVPRGSCRSIPPAQRTALEQRPHQETGGCQVATREPVGLHHGREGGGDGHDEAWPSASTAWAARRFDGFVASLVDQDLDLLWVPDWKRDINRRTLCIKDDHPISGETVGTHETNRLSVLPSQGSASHVCVRQGAPPAPAAPLSVHRAGGCCGEPPALNPPAVSIHVWPVQNTCTSGLSQPAG